MTDLAWLAIALPCAALQTAGAVSLIPWVKALRVKHVTARRRVAEADRSGGEREIGR